VVWLFYRCVSLMEMVGVISRSSSYIGNNKQE
jgi:hypothetical protein